MANETAEGQPLSVRRCLFAAAPVLAAFPPGVPLILIPPVALFIVVNCSRHQWLANGERGGREIQSAPCRARRKCRPVRRIEGPAGL